MTPIRDTAPCNTRPMITWGLIAVCSSIFVGMQLLPYEVSNPLITRFGMVPLRYSSPEWAERAGLPFDAYLSFLTNLFLHGSWFHLIANMWSLYLFGDNVEDRLGHLRFLLFYLLAGVAANMVHFAVNLDSTMPVIGASGAIAGVMAAYLRLFPFARIITLFPIFFIPYFFEVPAYLFMGIWFLTQVFSGAASLAAAEGVRRM